MDVYKANVGDRFEVLVSSIDGQAVLFGWTSNRVLDRKCRPLGPGISDGIYLAEITNIEPETMSAVAFKFVDDGSGSWAVPAETRFVCSADNFEEAVEAAESLPRLPRSPVAGSAVTITWDGSDYEKDFDAWCELSDRIEAELGEGYFTAETWRLDCLGIFRRTPRYQRSDPQDDSALVGVLTPGARIRIEGDSFAILPPEEVPNG